MANTGKYTTAPPPTGMSLMHNAAQGIGAIGAGGLLTDTTHPYNRTATEVHARLQEMYKTPKDTMNIAIKKITNGYILSLANEECYCEDMVTVGKTVTALMVKKFIEAPSPSEQKALTPESVKYV